MWAYHRFLDRITGGRFSTDRIYAPTLWLRTVGRKSGIIRENALIYLADGDRHVVVASNAGDPDDPAWLRNLMSAPETSIRIGRDRRPVVARMASPPEVAAYWPKLVKVFPTFDAYRAAVTRPLPVVILEPRSGAADRPPD